MVGLGPWREEKVRKTEAGLNGKNAAGQAQVFLETDVAFCFVCLVWFGAAFRTTASEPHHSARAILLTFAFLHKKNVDTRALMTCLHLQSVDDEPHRCVRFINFLNSTE